MSIDDVNKSLVIFDVLEEPLKESPNESPKESKNESPKESKNENVDNQ